MKLYSSIEQMIPEIIYTSIDNTALKLERIFLSILFFDYQKYYIS